ncbi:Gx transporter family protein [Sinanaerobacter chloroacetimidivorans]|jgi:heptaprenyl diphosphate synthase|uniref:Gx transporter family protein n=1 Tax=Sinanaerobacter chloroacetimidivorans TaxID=2818044 RepID=UPI001D05BF47|nr:Gx transporter family protein [Sinanaerobacter chloroacetimidivorans]
MDIKLSDYKGIANLNKTQQMVLTGLIFAVALVLAVVENTLPPLPLAVPGVKFGLSNIAVMYALFFLGRKQAYLIAVLKAFFVFTTRGAIAAALSLSGGLLSITVMILLMFLFRDKITYLIISILGAVFHNIGQFFVIILIYTGMNLWAYLPVLLISGLVAGIVTSTLLKFILPALKRLV